MCNKYFILYCFDYFLGWLFSSLQFFIFDENGFRYLCAIRKRNAWWKASVLGHLRAPPSITNYLLPPEAVCFQLIDGWLNFHVGKCSFTSNLFHLLWSNYQPWCQWLADYLCPASLAASQDRHAAISHFTIFGITWIFMVSGVLWVA